MRRSAKKAARRGAALVVALGLCLSPSLLLATTAGASSAGSGRGFSVGVDLSGTTDGPVDFDPAQFTISSANFAYDWPIYGGLLRLLPNGSYVPDLASKVTVPTPSTIDIQIRKGAVFSDGTPFTAAAVKAGLQRNLDTTNKGAFNSTFFDISSIDVTGTDSLTLSFSQPVANEFYPDLAGEESFIVSPKAAAAGTLSTDPVGAGPFSLKKYTPNQQIVLAKNPKYWDAKAIKLPSITFVSVTPGPQQVTALESGLVQAEVDLTPSDVPTLKQNSSLQVKSVLQDGDYLWVPVCKSSGPLANTKVRQALNYATNRKQIDQALLYGLGEPAWSIFPSTNALFDTTLTNSYAYNPKKAKQLLAQAGYAHGFTTSIVPLPESITDQTAQILQAEWKKVGVTLNIVQTSNFLDDFYQRHVAPMAVIPESSPGLAKVSGPYGPSSIGNVCNYSSASLNQLVDEAGALPPNSPKLKSVWDQMQQFVIGNALSVYVDFVPSIAAATTSVVNFQTLPYTDPTVNYWGISMRS